MEEAVDMLHDHEFFLHCDPHMSKFSRVATETPPVVPDTIKASGETEVYRVTDVVQALPAGLWDSNVESTYEFTDTADGCFVRIRSPLSVVMETMWTIKEEDGRLQLVEDVFIQCSRLLVGIVKSQCEKNWQKIHGKMIERLEAAPKSS
jgi:hypothetical protein